MNNVEENCMIAQSGGPTSVINATAYGCIREFMERRGHGRVYAALYGLEGLLQNRFVEASALPQAELEKLRCMPGAAFGSNRYRLRDYRQDDSEYARLFRIFRELQIRYFFYIGGNDSMDAAFQLSAYAAETGYELSVCGVPKTIDNDLVLTDHCPGFGSAAKFVVTTAAEMWMDVETYDKPAVLVVEAMGRDAGWLAASAGILPAIVPSVNLLVYVPEKAFSHRMFLADVNNALQKQNHLLVVTSEGLKNVQGAYIPAMAGGGEADAYGHPQLGGIGKSLQRAIRENITDRVKLEELGILQRCSAFCASRRDRQEAEMAGRDSVKYALEGDSGFMTALVRKQTPPYGCTTQTVRLEAVRNRVRHLPPAWLQRDEEGVNPQLLRYMEPLIFDAGELAGLAYSSSVTVFRPLLRTPSGKEWFGG